jgi:hypothetical protein
LAQDQESVRTGGEARGGRGLGTEAQWPMSAAASHHLGRSRNTPKASASATPNGQTLVYVYFFQAADGGLRALTKNSFYRIDAVKMQIE